MLYCTLLITQIYEWIVYIIFLRFQSSYRYVQHVIDQKKNVYNKREKFILFCYLATVSVFCISVFLCDKNVKEYLNNNMESNKMKAKRLYIANLLLLLCACIIVSIIYIRTLAQKGNEHLKYHRSQIIKYNCFIILSILLKLYLVHGDNIFSYSYKTFPVYQISELTAMTMFSIFKKDEDCIECFKISTIECFSIFQIARQNSNKDEYFDDLSSQSTDRLQDSDILKL